MYTVCIVPENTEVWCSWFQTCKTKYCFIRIRCTSWVCIFWYTPDTFYFRIFYKFFNNIQVREAMSHRNDKDWKWSPTGQFVTVFTKGAAFKRPNGTTGTIWSPSIERALGDNGMLYSPTDEERDDLTRFLMMASDSTAAVGDAAGDDEF